MPEWKMEMRGKATIRDKNKSFFFFESLFVFDKQVDGAANLEAILSDLFDCGKHSVKQ